MDARGRRGLLTGGALVAAAGLHVAWAAGSTWPAGDRDALADLVVGSRPMPGPLPCAAVAAALLTAGHLVATSAGTVRPRPRRVPRGWWPLGAAAVAAVLGARGAGGLAAAVPGLAERARARGWGVTEQFRRRDRVLYSPLCLALAVGAADAARGRRAEPEPRATRLRT